MCEAIIIRRLKMIHETHEAKTHGRPLSCDFVDRFCRNGKTLNPLKANLPSHLPWDWAFLEISVDMNSVDR
jgi:hypothetical protein